MKISSSALLLFSITSSSINAFLLPPKPNIKTTFSINTSDIDHYLQIKKNDINDSRSRSASLLLASTQESTSVDVVLGEKVDEELSLLDTSNIDKVSSSSTSLVEDDSLVESDVKKVSDTDLLHSSNSTTITSSSTSTTDPTTEALEEKKTLLPEDEFLSPTSTISSSTAEVVKVAEVTEVVDVAEITEVTELVEEQTLLPSDEELLSSVLIKETEKIVDSMVDEICEVEPETGLPEDPELCVDESSMKSFRQSLTRVISKTLRLVNRSNSISESDLEEVESSPVPEGELLEQGWEKRGNSSALRRNAEVWKFALNCVFKALKPRKLRKSGKATDEEIKNASYEAAVFIRDGLLRLGPTFVKLGQVVSTRTDVLPDEYCDVLKTLQDDVPGFSGKRAKDIILQEFGKPCDKIFKNFSEKPLAAASLGQVHTAMYKGQKVAVKVQRAGLKELFDIDLKNLKKLAVLLDKFDPKTDGADRDWVSIYEESERLLYLEIDYLNEAANAERFSKDFNNIDYVRVPDVYKEVTTPRVLTMEFIESFKLTDLDRVDQIGLNRQVLAKKDSGCLFETNY